MTWYPFANCRYGLEANNFLQRKRRSSKIKYNNILIKLYYNNICNLFLLQKLSHPSERLQKKINYLHYCYSSKISFEIIGWQTVSAYYRFSSYSILTNYDVLMDVIIVTYSMTIDEVHSIPTMRQSNFHDFFYYYYYWEVSQETIINTSTVKAKNKT